MYLDVYWKNYRFILIVGLFIVFDEYVRRGGWGSGGKVWEMDFESFFDFVLVLENREILEGLIYLFKCLDF